MNQHHNIGDLVTDALYSVRTPEEWDALFTATLKEDRTSEDASTTATDAYNDAMYGEASPVIVSALTAVGVTCDTEGSPGDGIAAAGSVGSGHGREFIVIIGPDGTLHGPEEVLERWISLAQVDLDAQED